MLDEDTHLSLGLERPVIGSVPLRNVPSKSVCPISRSDRKNLAVHVSLSSIFTMSKSGPREPLSRATSSEAGLPKFWGTGFCFRSPGSIPALSENRCRGAARPSASARRVICADRFGCQHPKMTKPTKKKMPVEPPTKPRRRGAFNHRRQCR